MTTLIALFCCFKNEFKKSCVLCRNFISISHSFASLTRERYFQHSKIKFVSSRYHVISSIFQRRQKVRWTNTAKTNILSPLRESLNSKMKQRVTSNCNCSFFLHKFYFFIFHFNRKLYVGLRYLTKVKFCKIFTMICRHQKTWSKLQYVNIFK